ncbi:MAG: hypothetical protein GWN01_06500 [Nitrosopumilaceae archaeon]|nr:hypothetical protein [Nitrosopumilaceae archaeon]NIU00587.1 hypothetical protein [Nitrosopumilaceae archaeon]NIU86973.1 hypothetical protein [Nitrosopumilaceae archaeon]NIV66437.1 hypothetical protein [Nitrosopumilaceae archaeon]NIX61189.1 hypothetical protein [Nitrosopumilaceae archaeon]
MSLCKFELPEYILNHVKHLEEELFESESKKDMDYVIHLLLCYIIGDSNSIKSKEFFKIDEHFKQKEHVLSEFYSWFIMTARFASED